MKKINGMVLALACAATLALCAESPKDLLRQAVQGAIGDAEIALKAAPIAAGEAVAILPLADDGDGWIAGQLKTALTAAGKTCVVGKEDAAWAEILKEVEWDARKADILDPATVAKFGRLKAAQTLLAASMNFSSVDARQAFVELELHAVSIATKKHVWGGSFAKRVYSDRSGERKGITEIPVEVRNVMIGKFRERLGASLKASTRLRDVKTAALLPLVGDEDVYGMNIVRDVLTGSALRPINLGGAETRGDARLALREGHVKADALVYGAVREISARVKSTNLGSMTYTATVELQVCVEKVSTRELLWSDTVSVSEDFTLTKGMWDMLCQTFPVLRAHPILAWLIPAGVLVFFLLLILVMRAMIRVR